METNNTQAFFQYPVMMCKTSVIDYTIIVVATKHIITIINCIQCLLVGWDIEFVVLVFEFGIIIYKVGS